MSCAPLCPHCNENLCTIETQLSAFSAFCLVSFDILCPYLHLFGLGPLPLVWCTRVTGQWGLCVRRPAMYKCALVEWVFRPLALSSLTSPAKTEFRPPGTRRLPKMGIDANTRCVDQPYKLCRLCVTQDGCTWLDAAKCPSG